MSAESHSTLTVLERLQELAEESRKEYERAQRELKEMDGLIRQSTREVDKCAQRSTQAAQQLRQIEANPESYPREEIKAAYSAAQDAQMRLFMMRNQVEQLQNKQENLTRFCQQTRRFLEIVGQFSAVPEAATEKEQAEEKSPVKSIIRIIEVQENERQHLARQMHDGPAQALTNLILQAEICERLFDTDPTQARSELSNLKNAVTATFQKTRDFIVTLRPMMLDDLGLLPTLRRYIENFEKRTGISASLTAANQERRYPPHTEVTVFRVVQEALNNVEQHAHASHVRVALDFQEIQVIATVEDDGSGFDVANALAMARQRKTLGLIDMQERAEMLGGTFQVESYIGRGTRARLVLPAS